MSNNINQNDFGLPKNLGDGLVLRWATPADADELGEFNFRMHNDSPDEPEHFLRYWTHDLMRGDHPTTHADDFTVVVDETTDKIVSSMNLISQTWAYEGIPFKVGRPELVATEPAYRRKGLVRLQFEAIHAKSASRGELVQVITGIPWYYRQFGYEMTVSLHGSRRYFWGAPGNNKPATEEKFTIRPAETADIPTLLQLYPYHCANALLSRVRTQEECHFEGFVAYRDSPYARHFYLIETADSTPIAYAEFYPWRNFYVVREVGVAPGHNWREVSLFLVRHLKTVADELNKTRLPLVDHISFDLTDAHPVYDALDKQLERQRPPYAYFVRVPDLPAFLQHIAPALEKRLADSILVGYSGTLRLNFYRSHLALSFENGRFTAAAPYTPTSFDDCDAAFPDLTFLHVLFGHRAWEEIRHLRADCYANSTDTAALLSVLFPKRPSQIVSLG